MSLQTVGVCVVRLVYIGVARGAVGAKKLFPA